MKNGKVIDADGHVFEHAVDWADRLRRASPPYIERAPKWVKDDWGRSRVVMEGRLEPIASGPGQGSTGPFAKGVGADRVAGSDPNARLKGMDQEGVDVAILFGTSFRSGLCGLMDGNYAAALCHAYNNWLAEFCSADVNRLKGAALVPLQNIPAAIAEMERAVTKLGMVTVCLSTNVYGKNLNHPDFWPFLEAAQSLGVPLSIHPTVGQNGRPGLYGVQSAGSERFDRFFFTHIVGFPFELMISVLAIVAGGIFERFPRLKFAFLEGGAGWLPFWMERMDEHYEKLAPQVPEIRRPPSEYVKSENFYISTEAEESMLPAVLEHVGEDRVLYSSDYPHWDCSFPNSVRHISERENLSDQAKRKVLGENAARLFRL
jgi:hypothetical protein